MILEHLGYKITFFLKIQAAENVILLLLKF